MIGGGKARDVIVLAGAGVLANWFIALARDAAALSHPPWEFDFCDGDAVLADLGRTDGVRRTVIVAGPNRTVIDVIAAGSPVIGLLDDPVDCVRFLAEKAGADVLKALRVQTRYACAHELLRDNPFAHLLHRGSPRSARALVQDILGLVGRDLDAPRREQIVDRFGGSAADAWSLEDALATVDGYVALPSMSERVAASDVAVIRRVLSPLLAGALTRDVEFRWPRSAFLSGDDPLASVPPVADVTGGARIIFFGPYFHLPSGDWTVTLLVTFSDRVRDTPFRLRLLCMQDTLAQVTLTPAEGGTFQGDFRIHHIAPESWLELQFWTLEGMIEGQVAIGEVRFRRSGPMLLERALERP